MATFRGMAFITFLDLLAVARCCLLLALTLGLWASEGHGFSLGLFTLRLVSLTLWTVSLNFVALHVAHSS